MIDLDAIQARHDTDERLAKGGALRTTISSRVLRDDRAALLAEVRRLQGELDAFQYDADHAYTVEHATRLASLWEAGKLIGGDGTAAAVALLQEVRRLRGLCGKAAQHIDHAPRCAKEPGVAGCDCGAEDTVAELREAANE